MCEFMCEVLGISREALRHRLRRRKTPNDYYGHVEFMRGMLGIEVEEETNE